MLARAGPAAETEKRLPRDGVMELNEALELNSSALLRIFTDLAYQRRIAPADGPLLKRLSAMAACRSPSPA